MAVLWTPGLETMGGGSKRLSSLACHFGTPIPTRLIFDAVMHVHVGQVLLPPAASRVIGPADAVWCVTRFD